jgi:hypothetical protein
MLPADHPTSLRETPPDMVAQLFLLKNSSSSIPDGVNAGIYLPGQAHGAEAALKNVCPTNPPLVSSRVIPRMPG